MRAADTEVHHISKRVARPALGKNHQRFARHSTVHPGVIQRRLDDLVTTDQRLGMCQVLIAGIAFDQRSAPEVPLGVRSEAVGEDDRQRDLAFPEIVADGFAQARAVATVVERIIDPRRRRFGIILAVMVVSLAALWGYLALIYNP